MRTDSVFCVYILTFPNNKVYIGQTCQIPERRWANGNGYSKVQPVRCAIDKYGWKNVKHKILYSGLSKEEADYFEKKEISMHESWKRSNGYNVLPGGVVNRTGFKNTEAQNEKISRSHMKPVVQYDRFGNQIAEYDSILDASKSLGVSFKPISSVCNGDKKTAYGSVWRFAGDDFDAFDSLPLKPGAKGTPVAAYDDSGALVAIYATSKCAERMTGFDHGGILRCCNGKAFSYRGFVWKYYKEGEANAEEK